MENKEKQESFIEQLLAGLPAIVWTAVEPSDVDGEIMVNVVKESEFNQRFPCRHAHQRENLSACLTTATDFKDLFI